MKHHLASKHSIDYGNNDVAQPKATQFFSLETKSQKYRKKHPVNLKARNILVKWICKRNRTFSIVDDPELSAACKNNCH